MKGRGKKTRILESFANNIDTRKEEEKREHCE
jgi:hypothetical protein